MGEIKSTWELVMEKLKEMEITEKDRQQFRKEEERERAKRLFFPYFEGDARDWEGFKGQVRELGEEGIEALMELLSENLSPEKGLPERYRKGIEALFGPKGLQEIEALLEGFRQRRQKEEEVLKGELLRAFERKGLKGNAIDPNPRLHPRWGIVIEELEASFRKQIREVLGKLSFELTPKSLR